MKRFLLSVLSVAAMASANADEGMWTLCNLDSAVYRQMVAEGFELSYDDLYKGDSALKNACVNFGGFCSGKWCFVVIERFGPCERNKAHWTTEL